MINNNQTSFDSHLLYTTPTAGLHVILNFESEVKKKIIQRCYDVIVTVAYRSYDTKMITSKSIIPNLNSKVEEVVSEFSINIQTLLTRCCNCDDDDSAIMVMLEMVKVILNHHIMTMIIIMIALKTITTISTIMIFQDWEVQ